MAEWEMSCVGDGKPRRGGHCGRGRYGGKCGLKGQLDFYKRKVFLAYCLGLHVQLVRSLILTIFPAILLRTSTAKNCKKSETFSVLLHKA